MKIDRVLLASNNNKLYYEFWNPISKVYYEKFNLKPTLVWVGAELEKKFCGISEQYGETVIAQPNKKYPINTQCTLATYWATQFFPNDVCLICGIDEIALSGLFLKDKISEFSDDSYVMFISDAYQGQHWSKKNSVSPSGYHVAKGKIFQNIYNFKKTFSETIEDVYSSNVLKKYMDENVNGYPSENQDWGLDETFISQKLRDYNGKYNIVSLNEFNLMQKTRIECFRTEEPQYDLEKLRKGGYSHSHLCRPYSSHEKYLKEMFQNIPKIDN